MQADWLISQHLGSKTNLQTYPQGTLGVGELPPASGGLLGTEVTSPLHRTGASGKKGSVLRLREGYGHTKVKASAGA